MARNSSFSAGAASAGRQPNPEMDRTVSGMQNQADTPISSRSSLEELNVAASTAGVRGAPPVTFLPEDSVRHLVRRRTQTALEKKKAADEKISAKNAARSSGVQTSSAVEDSENVGKAFDAAEAAESALYPSSRTGGRASDYGRRGITAETDATPEEDVAPGGSSAEELSSEQTKALKDAHKKNVLSGNDNPHKYGTEAYDAHMANAEVERVRLEKQHKAAKDRENAQSKRGTSPQQQQRVDFVEQAGTHEEVLQGHLDAINSAAKAISEAGSPQKAPGALGAMAAHKAAYFVKRDMMMSHPDEIDKQNKGTSVIQSLPQPCLGTGTCPNMVAQNSTDVICDDCAADAKINHTAGSLGTSDKVAGYKVADEDPTNVRPEALFIPEDGARPTSGRALNKGKIQQIRQDSNQSLLNADRQSLTDSTKPQI